MTRAEKREQKRKQKMLGFKIALFPPLASPEEVLVELLGRWFDLTKPFLYERNPSSRFIQFVQGPVKSMMRVRIERVLAGIRKFVGPILNKIWERITRRWRIKKDAREQERLEERVNAISKEAEEKAEEQPNGYDFKPTEPSPLEKLIGLTGEVANLKESDWIDERIKEVNEKILNKRIEDLQPLKMHVPVSPKEELLEDKFRIDPVDAEKREGNVLPVKPKKKRSTKMGRPRIRRKN